MNQRSKQKKKKRQQIFKLSTMKTTEIARYYRSKKTKKNHQKRVKIQKN